MARETPEPTTPPTGPDDQSAADSLAPTVAAAPTLGLENDLAAADRERALRGDGQPQISEPVEEQPER